MKSIKSLFQEKDHYNIDIYPHKALGEIREFNLSNKCNLFEYLSQYEDNIENFFDELIDNMLINIKESLSKEGYSNNDQQKKRLAKEILFKSSQINDKYESEKISLLAYAYAASEEYTDSTKKEVIIISSLVYYYYYQKDYTKQSLIEALSIAGLLANIVKENNREIDLEILIGSIFIAYLNDANVSLLEYTAITSIKTIKTKSNNNSLNLLQCFEIERLSRITHDLRSDKETLDNLIQSINNYHL